MIYDLGYLAVLRFPPASYSPAIICLPGDFLWYILQLSVCEKWWVSRKTRLLMKSRFQAASIFFRLCKYWNLESFLQLTCNCFVFLIIQNQGSNICISLCLCIFLFVCNYVIFSVWYMSLLFHVFFEYLKHNVFCKACRTTYKLPIH